MIEIVKAGYKKYIKCSKCRSILRYGIRDEKYNYFDSNDNTYEAYIMCPECNNKIVTVEFEDNELKKYWRKSIEDAEKL